jgi:cold shock CspA family protein
VRIGVVVDYDAERGLGTIDAGDGLMVSFHCVDIADGTRHVALGSVVAFEVAPGHRGQPEARHVMVPAAMAHVASPARSDDER